MVLEKSTLTFLICYASQKGTAQSIAEDISEQCNNQELKYSHQLSCISEIKNINNLNDFLCVIFVGSTTGDGEPPETARKFMRELKQAVANTSLVWLNYTILGLGDTNYTNFCNFGKTLDKTLQKGNAQRFYECGWADDGTGLEIVVEPWIEGLFPILKSYLDSPEANRKSLIIEEQKLSSMNTMLMNQSSDSFNAAMDSAKLIDDKLQVEEQTYKNDLSTFYPKLDLFNTEELANHEVKKLNFSMEEKLSTPNISSSFILTEFLDQNININHKDIISKEGAFPYPFALSNIIPCRIASRRKLTTDSAVKKALEISLKSISDEDFQYEPGDSFSIIVKNREDEVNLLLHLLRIDDKADKQILLNVDPNTTKKAAAIPKFIPKECNLRYIFTHCLDIRAIPKKPFLRSLIEYTVDPLDKRRLTEFVSKEGSEAYNKFFRLQGLTFLDLLVIFPSCSPPISLVLEHLPRLLPRPYSITSTPLVSPGIISFVFNIVEIPKTGSVTFKRQGLCTGWLNSLTRRFQGEDGVQNHLHLRMENLTLESQNECEDVLIYFRSNQIFRIPKEINIPLILIGPGTGVAPFIGFLKHREAQISKKENDSSPVMWLFFGCRHKSRDFLYKGELDAFMESGILTELSVSFSRDENTTDEPKYVQDNLILNGKKVIECINNNNAAVFVCGDAKNMSKNVFDTFITLLQKYLQLSEIDARKYVAQMQLNKRYFQDVWA